jgi:hypothetical protein
MSPIVVKSDYVSGKLEGASFISTLFSLYHDKVTEERREGGKVTKNKYTIGDILAKLQGTGKYCRAKRV